jgi:hypothetical protein
MVAFDPEKKEVPVTSTPNLSQDYPRVRAAIDVLADWVKNLETAARDQFAALDRREVASIAHDLGLTEHELRAVAAKGPDAAKLLLERMKALHLDPETISREHPEVMHDMQRLCSLCEAGGRCQRDLAKRPSDPRWEKYCPNAQTLHALEREARP